MRGPNCAEIYHENEVIKVMKSHRWRQLQLRQLLKQRLNRYTLRVRNDLLRSLSIREVPGKQIVWILSGECGVC